MGVVKNNFTSSFDASALLLTMNFVITLSNKSAETKKWAGMLALTLRSFNVHLTQSKWLVVWLAADSQNRSFLKNSHGTRKT